MARGIPSRGSIVLAGIVSLPEESTLSAGALPAQELRKEFREIKSTHGLGAVELIRVTHNPWKELQKIVREQKPDLMVLEGGHCQMFGLSIHEVLQNAPWAYLRSLLPNSRANLAHDLRFPFGWRYAIAAWKWLYFTPGPFASDGRRPAVLDRGAYLVEALGHCGECHTPRTFLSALIRDRPFAGGKGPTGKDVPNLTPTRLKKWSDAELGEYLVTGITPEFDSADESMAEIVRNTTSRLTPADVAAIIAYLRALPPLPEASR